MFFEWPWVLIWYFQIYISLNRLNESLKIPVMELRKNTELKII